MNGLRLDLSLRQFDGGDTLGATYRDEGLSVGADHMRLYGEDVEMEVSYNDLILGRRIGQGACSSVNLAQHKRTGETYAIKLFNIHDRTQASQLYNEILLLTSFSCDALISLKGAFHDAGSIGVILEYMDRGSLEYLLDPAVRVSEAVIASVAFQMVWGLGYLHHEKQIHRDIKPGNALMNSQGQVKLSDFGISKELDHTTAMSNSAVGSYMYMSPERLLGDKYDGSADVWSVGLSIVQLWTKCYPFLKASETPIHLSGELDHFDVYNFSMNPQYPVAMRSFIRSTLAKMPSDRSTCLELIRDCSWFQSFRLVDLESAHAIVKAWLQDHDRLQAQRMPAPRPISAQSPQPSFPQRQDIRLPRGAGGGFDMSQTLGSEDGMAMSVSFNQQSLRRPNPFTSSGSLSSSFMQQAQHSFHQYNQRTAGRSNGGPLHHGDAMQEDEYDDDFEEEVDAYDHRLAPANSRYETKFSESKQMEQKGYRK